MGQQQSKDELLYEQVNYGNTEGIKSLRSDGAGLEWIDKERKTPLIVACMNPELYNVAKTLIELGANVNAYRPGRYAGTPLHHAAKRGIEQTVKLLLSHGANALLMNDDCQSPLDVARVKGYSNVVRAIESHLCLFSGWLRELYGPGFVELLAPQLLSRKVWAVILPCGSRNLTKPLKLELAIYSNSQDPQPRLLIALWKANMDEPKFSQPDPAVILTVNSTITRRWRQRRGILSSQEARRKPRRFRQTRIKLAAANETEKEQLRRFCNACKGIPSVMHSTFPFDTQAPPVPASAPPNAEDLELTMAINASLQSSMQETPPLLNNHPGSGSNSIDIPSHSGGSAMVIQEAGPSNNPAQHIPAQSKTSAAVENPIPVSVPAAPPVVNMVIDDGPIHYPTIDSSFMDLSSSSVETSPAKEGERKEDTGSSSSCVICLDARVEGACIPCGHMAGCMSCLNEIKAKKWGCPVCRAKIDQVIRLYPV